MRSLSDKDFARRATVNLDSVIADQLAGYGIKSEQKDGDFSSDDEETEALRDELSALKSELQSVNIQDADAKARATKSEEAAKKIKEAMADLK